MSFWCNEKTSKNGNLLDDLEDEDFDIDDDIALTTEVKDLVKIIGEC
jgi:hypothetical protein